MHSTIYIVLLIFGYYSHVQATLSGAAFMGYGYEMPDYQMGIQTRNTFYAINEPFCEFSSTYSEKRPYQHVTSNTCNMNIVSPLCGCKYPLSGTGFPSLTFNGDEATNVPGCCGKYLRQVTLQPPYL
ncbi:uncharacterized protein LOC123715662 [Pieris brassicae]|uniref:Uncharacterized protein n=1 Tax=Pieris brassicae TaxID=7116 RepID=A0A9P0TJE7_PIEBR|nr:uncharacterized protein LOC123715662 [Pieris brassicae]CAH4032641.1 unnamed protein product [Pieris brassicae]